MTHFLLAAEADQIQDTIFRATHLREVVGGSQLLSRFCSDGPRQLGISKYPGEDGKINAVVNDGGSFRLLVEGTEREAQEIGMYLAEMYRLSQDGSLTVARPVETLTGGFETANQQASARLRRAKRRAYGAEVSPQFPFMALCATCGVGLATEYAQRHPEDATETPNYLCASCRAKTQERTRNSYGAFLGPFYQKVGQRITLLDEEDGGFSEATLSSALAVMADPEHSVHPGKDGERVTGKGIFFPEDSDAVAGYDPRNYVAYLLADVNNMGRVFDQCRSEEQLSELSHTLPLVIRESLAYPTAQMMAKGVVEWFGERTGEDESRFSPVLPLILGGDDLFALLPAPFAIDATLQFCQQFTTRIKDAFETGILAQLRETLQFPLPTISACVVICKSNYPFYLAHQTGRQGLNDAKVLTKSLHQRSEIEAETSSLTFELVLGSQLSPGPSSAEYRPTLRPYFTRDVGEVLGKPASALLEHRLKLNELPGARRSELRGLFDPPNIPGSPSDLPRWIARRDRLLGRIQRMVGEEGSIYLAVKTAMEDLGGEESWRRVRRPLAPGFWQGTGFPDLLDLWDFTFQIDRFPGHYEAQEG